MGHGSTDLSHHQYHPMPPTSSFDSAESNSQSNSNSSLTAPPYHKPPALPPKKYKMKHSVSELEELSPNASQGQEVSMGSVGSPPKSVTSPTHSLPSCTLSSGAAILASTPVHLTGGLG